jgi:hypothetical protein
MISSVIGSFDIQENPVMRTLHVQSMMRQVLDNKQIMQSTTVGQEARLAGKKVPMLLTVSGMCRLHSSP